MSGLNTGGSKFYPTWIQLVSATEYSKNTSKGDLFEVNSKI